jgi:hypothetical protein
MVVLGLLLAGACSHAHPERQLTVYLVLRALIAWWPTLADSIRPRVADRQPTRVDQSAGEIDENLDEEGRSAPGVA